MKYFVLAIIIALCGFGTFLTMPVDPKREDMKIIEAYNDACIFENQLKKAEQFFDKCISNYTDKDIAKKMNEQCRIESLDYAMIRHYNDGSMYDSDKSDYRDNKILSGKPLSNGTIYSAKCPYDAPVEEPKPNSVTLTEN